MHFFLLIIQFKSSKYNRQNFDSLHLNWSGLLIYKFIKTYIGFSFKLRFAIISFSFQSFNRNWYFVKWCVALFKLLHLTLFFLIWRSMLIELQGLEIILKPFSFQTVSAKTDFWAAAVFPRFIWASRGGARWRSRSSCSTSTRQIRSRWIGNSITKSIRLG